MGENQYTPPYYYFTTLNNTLCRTQTRDQEYSISFLELLGFISEDRSRTFEKNKLILKDEKPTESLHFTFLLELDWLRSQYEKASINFDEVTIIYEKGSTNKGSNTVPTKSVVRFKDSQTHHSKISIFKYNDKSIRIIVSTANLTNNNWTELINGLWISPKLPYDDHINNENNKDSVTKFKNDFLHYLRSYNGFEYSSSEGEDTFNNFTRLQDWISHINNIDFTAINVFFVASITKRSLKEWGIGKLRQLLIKNNKINSEGKIVIDCPNIGKITLEWCESFIEAIGGIKVIDGNRVLSYEIVEPSISNKADSQIEFVRKSRNGIGRPNVTSHIKSYAKITNEGDISWFLLTSANLNDITWKSNMYDAGVLFLPDSPTGVFSREIFRLPYDMD